MRCPPPAPLAPPPPPALRRPSPPAHHPADPSPHAPAGIPAWECWGVGCWEWPRTSSRAPWCWGLVGGGEVARGVRGREASRVTPQICRYHRGNLRLRQQQTPSGSQQALRVGLHLRGEGRVRTARPAQIARGVTQGSTALPPQHLGEPERRRCPRQEPREAGRPARCRLNRTRGFSSRSRGRETEQRG